MTDRELAGCALAEVLALLEKATPGEITTYDANDGDGWPPRPLWCVKNADYDSDSDDANPLHACIDYGGKEDADAIAAAVNFLRKHGPALLVALSTPSSEGDGRDGERLLYLVKDGGVEGFRHVKADIYDYACDAAEESGRDEPSDADMLSGMRRLIDAAIAAAEGAKES